MGFLDNTTITLDAILTRKGREKLAREGNLDITMGDNTRQCRPSSTSGAITVTGDVIVREGILLRAANDCTGAMSFGSLEIQSGGIYAATSDTTTLNGSLANSGTFTHNNGKFVFDVAGLSSSSNVRCSSSFYDVELTMGSFSLTSHHNMNVARDFTVTTGTYSDGSNGFTIGKLLVGVSSSMSPFARPPFSV